MKRLILLVMMLCLGLSQLFSQPENRPLRQGNRAYEKSDFEAAAEKYRLGLEKNPNNPAGHFNLGDALYNQGNFQEAAAHFNTAAGLQNDQIEKAAALHNLGNSLLSQDKYRESIEVYKQALRLNPEDMDSKYNLSYALKKLKENPEQDKSEDQDKQEENEEQENEDQQENQENQENEQQQEGGQDQNDDQQGGQQEQQEQSGQEEQGEPKQQEQQAREGQLTREEAERLLEALKNEEKKVQEKLLLQQTPAKKSTKEKDW